MSDDRSSVQLVWFRDDLRVHDQPTLAAAAAAGPLVAVVVIDPRRFAPEDHTFPRQGEFFARFRLEAVADLRRRLGELGADLLVRMGDAADVVPSIAAEAGARVVHASGEPCPEERRVERRVRRELERGPASARLEMHAGSSLVDPADVPTPGGVPPRVFTRFRNLVERRMTIPPPVPAPDRLRRGPRLDPGSLPTLADLGLPEPASDPRAVLPFRGGESAGLARLEDWIFAGDHLRHYKQTRNGMLGAAYSSKFSPWLAHGCLGPRTVHEAILRYEGERVANDSTHWLVVELLWRDFFRLVARHAGARLFYAGGLRGLRLPWSRDEAAFEAWRRGRTGVPMVDANMRELDATGFMSNRGRQVVASFLARNLHLDWRLGAAWFESRLVDHDPSSNWGNWAYIAGVGNDAREFRWFDPYKQAERYDPDDEHARTWIPELEREPGDTSLQGPGSVAAAYPSPIVDVHASADEGRRRHELALALAADRPDEAPGEPGE